MATRLLSKSLLSQSRSSLRSSILIKQAFPSIFNVSPIWLHKDDNKQQISAVPTMPLIALDSPRYFSASSVAQAKRPIADRAREASVRAREASKRGAKVARKGAMTAGGMLQKYGPVFIGTYFTVYFSTLGAFYAGVDSGLLDPMTVMSYVSSADGDESKTTVHMVSEFLEHYSFTKEYAPIVEENPHFANLAVAWIAVKFTEPVRLALALAVVPRLANYLGFAAKEDELASPEEIEKDTQEPTSSESKPQPEEETSMRESDAKKE